MKETFGILPSGQEALLYTIRSSRLVAKISDFGATLTNLFVPDEKGNVADVVLAWEDCNAYIAKHGFLGSTMGRNVNRIAGGRFVLNGKTVQIPQNNGENSLHSGPDFFGYRIWKVTDQQPDAITFALHSPDGDQGFPGNADISVTYRLEGNTMRIIYDAISDRDTVFNLTNHSYFNLAGHDKPERAVDQELMMPGRFFTVTDDMGIPTGENRSVEGTPLDFRTPKPIGRDVDADYEPMTLRKGYDHNFEVYCNPAAVLRDPHSGRTMEISTDRPGIQIYFANFPNGKYGKDGVYYPLHSGIAFETQFYPDSVNHPQWPQPFYKAGEHYHSETSYTFK